MCSFLATSAPPYPPPSSLWCKTRIWQMFAELRGSSGCTGWEMGGNLGLQLGEGLSWLALGFPSGGSVPSERGQLLLRKTFDYKGNWHISHASGGADWRNTHLWSSFSVSLGKKKKVAIQSLCYPKQYFKKLATPWLKSAEIFKSICN